jgi:hypothetical protein
MSKPPGRCIFCNSTGVTDQHIWPDWLKGVLPRTSMVNYQIRSQTTLNDQAEPSLTGPNIRTRQGDPATRKVRKVCRPCNGGWMSRLESRAKPILVPLILGHSFTLAASDQWAIAAWAAMTTISAEMDDPETAVVPFSDRQWLMNMGEAPSHWYVWIGRYQGQRWRTWFRHHRFNYSQDIVLPQSVLALVKYQGDSALRIQVTTLVAGELLLQTLSGTANNKGVSPFSYVDAMWLSNIWPGAGPPIVWDQLPILGDSNVDGVANAFKQLFFEQRAVNTARRS